MIIGLIDHDRGKLNEASLEMLTLGRRLAEQLAVPLQAVLIGAAARPLAERLASYGVSTVYLVEHERLDDYAPDAWAESLAQLMAMAQPQAILAAGTDGGSEVLARLAAKTDLPLAANCSEVQPGEPYLVTRWRWGGSLLEEARLKGAVKLLTVALHAVPAEEAATPASLEITPFTPSLADQDFRVRVTGRVETAGGKVSLAEAKIVIGGGRGVGSQEGFESLEELAHLLGGAVGCSRAVTSLGWRPHADQIGQTGVRIAPELYIACGVSGAIQHMVGAKAAKRILAINTDAESPIVAKADYAIIADLHKVVPALSEEVRQAKANKKY
jgi:electron transfer flavoprotein alpha subunit